jgi:tetratricopeptide (TPR) repeat protein
VAKLTINQALKQAVKAHKAGQVHEAKRFYTAILNVQPTHPDANHNTGLLAVGSGKIELALPFFKTALETNPSNAQFWYSYIDALIKLDRLIDAKALLNQAKSKGVENYGFDWLKQKLNGANKAPAIKPNLADTYYNMGIALKEQNKLEESIFAYKKAISAYPDFAGAYYNMGNVLQEQNKLEEAKEAYIKAISIKPDLVVAFDNLGVVLHKQSKLEEAKEAYKKAISIRPDHVDAYNNMGIVLKEQNKLEEAKEAFNKALAIQPDNAEAHHNLSFVLLAEKDFDQGFIQSEWRWKTKERDGTFLQSAKPIWNGEKNQRVLVWGEQGIGDELMFSSIIPELYAASIKILVKCDKRLIPLFKRSFPTDVIYFSKDLPVPEDEYDFHIPMGSLPLIFRKSLDSFKKSASGYLKYDKSKTESIKAQLMQEYGKKIVGISWKTVAPIRGSMNRNIDLAKLTSALDSSNIQLISLQYGDISDEIEAVKRDFGIEVIQFSDVDNKNDIDGLAALMAACDTVVTIDNATTHLSGALGLPTKLMLPLTADWRWGLSDNSSYWYDAVQLYKQSEVNDWHSVLAQI